MVGEIVYPFETLPDPMSVVWSFFPYDEQRGVPATEPHPALVFETYEFREGQYTVKVAYGTSNAERGDQNFVVSNYNALMFAGLNKVTCFDLGRVKWLPWTSRWFASPDPTKYATPVIGCIQADGQEVLRSILHGRKTAGLSTP